MESGFYTTTSSVVGLRRNSKALPKAKFAPKKGSWSLFGGLLPVWSTTAFWIPANPLHLRSMLSKLMRYTENYNGQPASVNRTGPILLWDNAWLHVIKLMLQKLNELSHKVLPHISFSPDLLSKDYYFFKHLNNFLQRKCFYNSWRKKMLSKSSLNPKAWFLCYRNK